MKKLLFAFLLLGCYYSIVYTLLCSPTLYCTVLSCIVIDLFCKPSVVNKENIITIIDITIIIIFVAVAVAVNLIL